MRVALYEPIDPAPDPPPFGESRLTDTLEAALVGLGHDVSRIPARSPEDAGRLRRFDNPSEAHRLVTYLQSSSDRRLHLWLSIRVSERAPDAIGATAGAALDIPYVLVQPDLGRDDARAAGRADATIVFSSAHAAAARETLPQAGDRLIVLPPFIDMGPIIARDRTRGMQKAMFATRYRIRTDVPWLIAAGPMATDRDLASFRIVARTMALLPTLDWRLIVAGAGPRQAEVQAMFRSAPLRLDHHLTVSTDDDLTALLLTGDLFLWPSVDERFSPTAVAAQAAGMGVVGGRSPAMADVVDDGRTGMLTKPGNDVSFANAVAFLLRHPEFRRTYAQQARQWAGANFDLAVVGPQLDAVLSRIAEDFKRSRPGTAGPTGL
ncbi:MAG: glycosyltransferase family 4 protein [Dongiaceae bacterium]